MATQKYICVYKELLQANNRKTKDIRPIKRWAKDLMGHFCKDDMQMAKKCTKRCSVALVIREMHIQTTVRDPSHTC